MAQGREVAEPSPTAKAQGREASGPPQAAADLAARLVAEQWEVEPGALRLDWGRFREDPFYASVDGAELLGSGRDGRWLVSFHRTAADGQEEVHSVALRAGIVAPRPVARTRLARGQSLSASDIEYRPAVCWGPPTEDPVSPREGWAVERVIEAGEFLAPPAVRPPLLVVSGRLVRIVWSAGAVRITVRGEAVGSAALGEDVFVRTESGQRMEGVVTGPAEVTLHNSRGEGFP